jgi:hypothetical protein
MVCRRSDQEEVIPKFLNGQLDAATEDNFGIHLLECSDCQDAVEMFEAVRADLIAREHQIRSYSGSGKRSWWPQVAFAAVILAVCGIGARQLAKHRQGTTQLVQQQSSKPAPVPPGAKSAQNAFPGPSDVAPEAGNRQTQHVVTTPSRPEDRSNAQDRARVPAGEESAQGQLAANPPIHSYGEYPPGSQAQEIGTLHASKETPAGNSTEAGATPLSPKPSVSEDFTQLAVVRPLPYSFVGVAASQPSRGGSASVNRVPSAAVSGNDSAKPKPGTTGFRTAQDYFTGGMSQYVDRNYEAAADLLGEAVRLDPDSSEASLYFGICKLLLGKPEDAVLPLQSAAREKKPNISQASHFYLAKAYLKLGKRIEAENELRASANIPGRLTAESNALILRLKSIPAAIPNSN